MRTEQYKVYNDIIPLPMNYHDILIRIRPTRVNSLN